MHSTIQSQHPPERSSLGFIPLLQQLHVTEGQVISDILEPGGVHSSERGRFLKELWCGLKEYLV